MTDLTTAKDTAKAKDDTIKAVAEGLKPTKLLPEMWKDADLVAAVKGAASRATGPDLSELVPKGMVAIGGGGLAAGQLLDIADRLKKAEAAAKVANEKIATETKKLTDKFEADRKTLTDKYEADVKKIKDTNAEEIKKLTDKFLADMKKLTDDHTIAIKAEQAKTEAEKKASMLKDIAFEKQLANALTPSQALDIWLPRLTDLRRSSDAPAAQAMAAKALTSSAAGSDDEAKAHTVNGMAFLLKGDLAAARDEFKAAKRSPAYKADKAWAKVADAGMEAVDDPLAPYRQPVVIPPTDPVVANKSLNSGILAYRAGKYEDAATALAEAAKNDPTDPIAWYYLGAARWLSGNEDQAKKDFSQGAEREKVSPLPARTVSAALAPIQGTVRSVIDKARP